MLCLLCRLICFPTFLSFFFRIEPYHLVADPKAVWDIVIDGLLEEGTAQSGTPLPTATDTTDTPPSNTRQNPVSSRAPEWVPGRCYEVFSRPENKILRSPHVNNKDKAIISYNARHGDPAAQVLLGDIFKDGNGVDQDLQVAINWYTRAAYQGYARGWFSIDVMSGQGLGVVQDFVRPAEFCRLAAEGGDERT